MLTAIKASYRISLRTIAPKARTKNHKATFFCHLIIMEGKTLNCLTPKTSTLTLCQVVQSTLLVGLITYQPKCQSRVLILMSGKHQTGNIHLVTSAATIKCRVTKEDKDCRRPQRNPNFIRTRKNR